MNPIEKAIQNTEQYSSQLANVSYSRSLMMKISVCLSELKSPNAATVPWFSDPNKSVVTSWRADAEYCPAKYTVNIKILINNILIVVQFKQHKLEYCSARLVYGRNDSKKCIKHKLVGFDTCQKITQSTALFSRKYKGKEHQWHKREIDYLHVNKCVVWRHSISTS